MASSVRRWSVFALVLGLLSLTSAHKVADDNGPSSRVIPLSDLSEHTEDPRLPRHVAPTGYRLEIQAFPAEGHFMGRVKINITCREPTDAIFLHAYPYLNIRPTGRITVTKINFRKTNSALNFAGTDRVSTNVKVLGIKRDPVREWLMIRLTEKLRKGGFYRVELLFDGTLNSDESVGFFRNSYVDHRTKERRWFAGTQMKPTHARRIFPCFDEPAYKVPFEVSVARPMTMKAVSNMPVRATEIIEEDWVWDHFLRTPPLATFSLGILISSLDHLPPFNVSTSNGNVSVRVYGRENVLSKLEGVSATVKDAMESLQGKFGLAFPLPEMNLVALPHFSQRAPADLWGLVFFQERVLMGNSCRWFLYNMMVTQWLGHLVTPHWWSDARLNQAIANYLATDNVLQTNSRESWNSWVGYSVYYEFDQPKDIAKITDASDDIKTTKTEWLLRMLSKSLTLKTFEKGLQEFLRERQYDTYFEDDVWAAMTKQAWEDATLQEPVRVEDIARSWIYQDRFPVVTVNRNYDDNTASVNQHTFVRFKKGGRVANDPLLWWIPVAYLTSDDLDLEMEPGTPVTWIKAEREVTLINLPDADKFIIVNPDETGMFMVNYDVRHWSLLSQHLAQTSGDGSSSLPSQVRSKLLHDAWSLAFGGELSFATALNVTAFMRSERSLPVWTVMLNMTDQLIAQIDGTIAAGKLREYVSGLLSNVYESLPPTTADEDEELSALREKIKAYLCTELAYGPCLDQAKAAYDQWIQTAATDGTMISDRYLCTMIKWDYSEEVEERLQTIMSSNRQLLRTHLAKCLRDPVAISSLLSETFLSEEGMKLNTADMYHVVEKLSSHVNGYTGLFDFLKANWDELRLRFENNRGMWNFILEKALGNFKSNRGFHLVKALQDERKGDPDMSDIKDKIEGIKEAAAWSNSILPDINSWLDHWMARNFIQH